MSGEDVQVHPDAEAWLQHLVRSFLPTQRGAAERLALQAVDYLQQKRAIGEDVPIDAAFLSRVLSIHTGLARPLVDPGPPAVSQVQEELIQHDCPSPVAPELARALLKMGRRGTTSGPLLALDIVGEHTASVRACVRAIAGWALSSPLRVVRANTAHRPIIPVPAARTLSVRPLQVIRLSDARPTDAAWMALTTGILPDGTDLRGALIARTSQVPLADPPGVTTLSLDRQLAHLKLVDPLGHSPAPALRPSPAARGALVMIEPVDGGPGARDHLAQVYRDWASSRSFDVEVIHEPVQPREAGILCVTGPRALDLLARETGLHRLRQSDRTSVARVRVGTARPAIGPVAIQEVTALKGQGLWGGRIRSRVSTERGLILQNGRTIAENRTRAIELESAWLGLPRSPETVVRRVQLDPFHVYDERAELRSSDPAALQPDAFDHLLRGSDSAAFDPGDGVA